ncbi:unnamed protein product [Adineta steineri]|uniref:Uncharacterized protein n=1 Tax=Adineta steineri TaxID=433720 RepID=A0A815JFI4_9BILA|nr:unnamed protein product [Adineta steineri]CAF3626108.1 unnamed protein product [Adineta steineri]
MITSNDDVMELKINEPISLSSSSLLKSHQHHHHESSGYSSKEAECSSPENKTHMQHRHHENKLRITANNNNNNNNNNSNRTVDIHRRRHRLPTSSTTVPNNGGSLTIDESSTETHNTEQTVITLDKSIHRLSPICDEQLITTTNTLSNHQHFPIIIPSDDNNPINSSVTALPRNSTKSPSHQATLFARRHFHVYDWTRLSFYDNVPPPLGYQSEPVFLDNRSPTATSASSADENTSKRSVLTHIRSPTDRKDSGLGTSSVERQIDSIVLTNNTDPLHRSTSSISSSSSSPSSSSSESDATNTIPTSTTPSRLPASRKIRVKWHSFTKSHRPSFNSSKYHLGQMSVGQLFALRRAASIRIQELLDTTRILSPNKDDQIPTLVNTTIATPQSLLATAFSAVPKLIIRRHQQRKESHPEIKDIKKLIFGVSLLSMTQRTGHPVPITIISAMKYLRRTSIDSVGIFRKPGVSNRIKRLHDLIESDLEFHQFDDFSPYDVSDVLKQYFRSLPECLFTTKLSPLFLNISEHFSTLSSSTSIDSTTIKLNNERRLRSLQYAVLLLPDENRLVLHLLLSFLNDVSKHSKTNQMSSINLATCFAPTLFSFHSYTNNIEMIDLPSSTRKHHQSIPSTNIMGMPDWREIQEQRKAMEILSVMIDHVRLLFLVPDELHQACHFSYIEIGEPCTLEELARRVSETTATSIITTTTTPILNKYRRCSSSNLVGKRTAQQRATEIGTISASDSIGSLSSSPSASSSCENILLNENLNSNKSQTTPTTIKSFSSSRLFTDDTNTTSLQLLSSSSTTTNVKNSYQGFIDRCIVEVMRESCYNKLKGWTSFGINNDLELAFKKLDDGHPLGLWKCSAEIEAPPVEILNRLLNERHLWDDDFQSGTIIEQLSQNTHVYQYTLNSMAPLASRYFCEVRSWRTNVQLNTNGSCQTSISTNNSTLMALPVGSSSSASSSAIASFITTQNPNNQKRDACVLVCTSIEHPKAHCPPTLVRAVTLASRYLIQSYGCGKSKVTHLSRVDLMGRSHEWYTKAYGSVLTRLMTKLRDSFAHLNTGPETKV